MKELIKAFCEKKGELEVCICYLFSSWGEVQDFNLEQAWKSPVWLVIYSTSRDKEMKMETDRTQMAVLLWWGWGIPYQGLKCIFFLPHCVVESEQGQMEYTPLSKDNGVLL